MDQSTRTKELALKPLCLQTDESDHDNTIS